MRHHLGDDPATLLGLQITLLPGLANNHGLNLGLANLTLKICRSVALVFVEIKANRYAHLRFLALLRGAELSRDLATGCLGRILGHKLLLYNAFLHRPPLTLLLN